MAQLKKTRLGTSDIPGDICGQGLALFPKIGTLRAGVSAGQKPVTLINVNPSVWVASLEFSVTNTVKTGICGPGYGVLFDLEGDTDTTQGKFRVSDDSAAAGFFVGHAVEPKLKINFRAFGKKLAEASVGHEIDLIELLIDIIRKLLADSTENGEADKTKETTDKNGVKIGLWSMYDQVFGELSSAGKMTVRPSYDFPIDIASKLGWLSELLRQLRKVGAKLTFGPGLSVMVPVTIRLNDVQYGETRYAPLSFANGEYTGKSQAPETRTHAVSTKLSHEPGFDIGLYLFASLKAGKWFKVGNKTPKLPLLKFMGIEKYVTAGPYYNCLENDEGAQHVGTTGCSTTAGLDDFEIVLDPQPVEA
ncbi:MAG TPA: hypothetical protein VET88_16120 [Gammaproteobacteria bacterium]|nr:hypothetical protein [Gammaproteobacteria bacterium]